MLKPRFLVGFSGHRSGYAEPAVRAALVRELAGLRERAESAGGMLEVYASAAEGTDLLCIEAARELGLPVHLLLPLPVAELQKDFSSPEAWERAHSHLEWAARQPSPNSVEVPEGAAQRPDCYFDQGIAMLNAVDVLLTVWDGQPPRGLGGTAQMVAQARATRIPVVHVDPQDGSATADPALGEALRRDPVIDELNSIAKRAGSKVQGEAAGPEALQKALDDIAMSEAQKLRPSRMRIILIHGTAAFLAALVTFKVMDKHTLWERYKWVISLTELALVCLALWMNFHLKRRQVQERWIRCRFACELVRGLRASIPLMNVLHPTITRHDEDWRRFALSAGLLIQAHQGGESIQVQRDAYLAVRLSETHPDGQIRHYAKMNPGDLRWWGFAGVFGDWCARLAPPFVLASVLNKLSKIWHAPDGWGLEYHFATWLAVGFLPIALPLAAGVATSLRHALDAGRRKLRYPQMVRRLRAIRDSLQGLETAATIRHAVASTEDLLQDELREWRLAATASSGR